MAETEMSTTEYEVGAPEELDGARPLPEFVTLTRAPRMSANEMRTLKAMTGRPLDELMSDPADTMQALVWLKLRREGYRVTWEQAGDVQGDTSGEAPDPTSSGGSTSLPPSAGSGDAPPGTLMP